MDELARLEENLHQETQAKENRNLQIVELEQTLAKESQRASDLKVTRETYCVFRGVDRFSNPGGQAVMWWA